MKKKLAIVMSGGGVRCSYGAGFLLALANEYKLKKPDILIGASGNAENTSYYVAGQYDSAVNIWENLLSTNKFIDKTRFSEIIDIDYLGDEVLKRQDKLRVEVLRKSKIKFFVPATNARTGKIEYFNNHDKVDFFEVLRATKSMPIVYNKEIKIGNKRYFDSSVSSSAEFNFLKAVELGAKRIIVIDLSSDDNFWVGLSLKAWLATQSNSFVRNYNKNKESVENFKIPKNIDCLWIRPKLRLTSLENDRHLLRMTVKQGYRETVKNKELKDFLKKK